MRVSTIHASTATTMALPTIISISDRGNAWLREAATVIVTTGHLPGKQDSDTRRHDPTVAARTESAPSRICDGRLAEAKLCQAPRRAARRSDFRGPRLEDGVDLAQSSTTSQVPLKPAGTTNASPAPKLLRSPLALSMITRPAVMTHSSFSVVRARHLPRVADQR